MGTFLKKDILVLIRDKSELIVLLLMPLILLSILGFALRGLLGGDTEAINMTVALVKQDDEQAGITEFINELERGTIPEETVEGLVQAANHYSPLPLLRQTLGDESIEQMIEVKEVDEETANKELHEGNIEAILLVPENFTYHSLQKMILNEGAGSELSVIVNNYSLQANVFQSVIDRFVDTLNFEVAITLAAGDTGASDEPPIDGSEVGGIETISTNGPITSFQYYTIGMAVMFVLFVSSTISSKAHVEKKQQVFNRILLTGTRPLVYLSGKMLSATVIAFIQLIILFSLSSLIFQPFPLTTLTFWLGMALISLALSLCVGGLAALLTALTVRWETDTISYTFAGGIVTLLAFVGGSFFPTTAMPEFLKELGNWTPNGAALTVYLQWMQGFGVEGLAPLLLRIIGITVVLVVLSLLAFPKRRSI